MTRPVKADPDGSLVWPEHGLEGEDAILADLDALVAGGFATWIGPPPKRKPPPEMDTLFSDNGHP